MAKLENKIIPSVTATEVSSSSSLKKDQAKKRLEEMIPRQMQLVEGTFVNEETKTANLNLDLPMKCVGIPPFKMVLEDGKTYKIPRWVANHLNGIDELKDILNPEADKRVHSCEYGVSSFNIAKSEMPGVNLDYVGSVSVLNVKYIKRFRFVPTNFGE